jgi:hypothetical protein
MTSTLQRLIDALGETDAGLRNRLLAEIDDLNLLPSTSEMGDWRDYLPDVAKAEWSTLPPEAKLVAFLICEPLSNEERI